MPTIRYTSDSGSYRDNHGNRADPDNPRLDVDDDTAAQLVEQFRFERVDSDAPKPDDDQPDLVQVGREPEYVEDGLCGYYNPESMDDPCARDAGWGTESDDGPCKDHAED